jgi:HEAT repeat protein
MLYLLISLASAAVPSTDMDTQINNARTADPDAAQAMWDAEPRLTRAGTWRVPVVDSDHAVWLLTDRFLNGDDGSDVRAGMAGDLARQGKRHPELLMTLVELEQDPVVLSRLVHGLTAIDDPAALDLLASNLAHDQDLVRLETSVVVGLHPSGAQLADALIVGLHDDAPEVRAAAARSLGLHQVSASAPALEAALFDVSGDVRLAAAVSLQTVDPARLELHAAELSQDADPRLVRAVQLR